jgi:hypothetical protein
VALVSTTPSPRPRTSTLQSWEQHDRGCRSAILVACLARRSQSHRLIDRNLETNWGCSHRRSVVVACQAMFLDPKLPLRAEHRYGMIVEFCRRFAILVVVSARLVCWDYNFAFTLSHLGPLTQPLTYPPKPHISFSRIPSPVMIVHCRGEVCTMFD